MRSQTARLCAGLSVRCMDGPQLEFACRVICFPARNDDMKRFDRNAIDADQLGGTPCIRGLCIPVATVVGMIGEGMAESEILKAYPDLKIEGIREALCYAAENLAADLTKQQVDGIRRRVRSSIAAIGTGKFREYEGHKSLKRLAASVKKAGRFPTKARWGRNIVRSGTCLTL
jgi:uncharacterized protein (DUF433 family)